MAIHKHDNQAKLDAISAVDTANVSNPPTDVELDLAFGTPASVGAGFSSYVNDKGLGINFYHVVSDGASWWVFTGTKAV